MLYTFNQFFLHVLLCVSLFLFVVNIGYSQAYDLALVLEETTTDTYAIGDQVSHTITICNQGNFSASTIVVTDHIPAGMTLSQADINGWSGLPTGPVTNTISAIPAGLCTTLDILLTVGPSVTSTTMVNHAEISQDNGNDLDSSPDSILGNDAGGAPNSPADNVMFGSGTGSPGDGVASTDEDDHDSEMILIDASSIAAPADPMLGSNEGDVFVGNALNGVILTSPDGTCYRLRVQNGGALTVEALACP